MIGRGDFGFMWLRMICGGLVMLLVLAAVVALIVWLVRAGNRTGGVSSPQVHEATPGPSKTLDILNERYARGEITKEQYDAMRHDIGV
jgi:putative membrane protein